MARPTPMTSATPRAGAGRDRVRPALQAPSQQQPPMDTIADDAAHSHLAFFVAATHDLKSPLSSLTLWLDTLEILRPRLARGTDAQTAALLDDVIEQMQTLLRRSVHMVDDVLDVVRLQAGRPLPFSPGEVDLVALARRALQGRPEGSDHVLRLESAASELWGQWDADRIARLLENLLANALKYSPVGSPVTVRLGLEDTGGARRAVLEVEDRGIGIPDAELPHIFEPFHRAPNVSSTIAGTGLGLWGCRTIVEQHGGTVTIASREREGTTVTVRLPLTPKNELVSI
jgi:signal transduction histidine kinase